MKSKVITLDLVPYNCMFLEDGKVFRIFNCQGSILRKLDTSNTDNRFAEDHRYSEIVPGKWAMVGYADGVFEIDTRYNCKESLTMEEVMEWLACYYDAIDSIGYECLSK